MKRTLHIILLLCIALPMASQTKFKPETILGVNGGITVSKVDFLPSISQSTLNGINGGLTFQYITERNAGLQVEFNYSQRGWKESFTDNPALSYSRQLTYIEMPFLTHIYFGQKNFRYFVNLGPKIGYLIGEKESGNYDAIASHTEIGKKAEHPFDYGICAGSGFELRTKIGNFLLEGRYCFGLSDIFYNSKVDPFTRSSNQIVSANLSYLIKL